MLKIDITKPIHAVARCLWEGSTATRVAKVLCFVPGSKCHAVVQIDGYSSPMIFDLPSGLIHGCSLRIENAPPKMVKKDVVLHTAVMQSKYNRIFIVSVRAYPAQVVNAGSPPTNGGDQGSYPDEITPDQFEWLKERAAQRRERWAEHARSDVRFLLTSTEDYGIIP